MDKRKIVIAVIALLMLAVLIVYGQGFMAPASYNARLEGRIFDVSPQVSGLVVKQDAQEDAFVSENFPLLELDSKQFIAELELATANLKALEQGVPNAQNNSMAGLLQWEQRVATANLAEKEAVAEFEHLSTQYAKAQLARRKAEIGGNADKIEKTRHEEKILNQALANARTEREQLGNARSKTEQDLAAIKEQALRYSTPEGMNEVRDNQLASQKVILERAKENLENTVVRAPVDGYILSVLSSVGQEVQAGTPIIQIVPLNTEYLWLTAYFDEKQVTTLQIGQECSIKLTALPELDLKGSILSIRAATNSLPLQDDDFSASFKSSKNMIPVKVSIDNYDADIMPQVRLGMTALVTPL